MPRGDGRKNHSVNRERSYVERKKASRMKHNKAVSRAKQIRKKSDALAYWIGEKDEHP